MPAKSILRRTKTAVTWKLTYYSRGATALCIAKGLVCQSVYIAKFLATSGLVSSSHQARKTGSPAATQVFHLQAKSPLGHSGSTEGSPPAAKVVKPSLAPALQSAAVRSDHECWPPAQTPAHGHARTSAFPLRGSSLPQLTATIQHRL